MSTTNYIEERIARACIAELLEHGFSIDVNDGEETTLTACTDPAAILAAMFSTDEDYLHARRNTGPDRFMHGWVRFIYGNDCDVISDYTTNLEPFLTKTNALVQKLSSDPSKFLAEEAERATVARALLVEFVAWAREHTGPNDGLHDILVRAVRLLEEKNEEEPARHDDRGDEPRDHPKDQLDDPWNEPGAPFKSADY